MISKMMLIELEKAILEELSTMDETVKKEILEDATNLKDAITDEIEFELDTNKFENKLDEIYGSIANFSAEVTNMGSGITYLKQCMKEIKDENLVSRVNYKEFFLRFQGQSRINLLK